MVDVIGIALTALIGAATSRLFNAGIDTATGRLPKPRAIEYVPHTLEMNAVSLTDVLQRRSQDLNIDERWQHANDIFRRTSQPKVSKAGREDYLRQASYNYNWIRRNERPGSLPQVHSALMYAFTTSMLGEDIEALRSIRESLSGRFGDHGISFTKVEVTGQGRNYRMANASLKITMMWRPPVVSGDFTSNAGYQTARLNGPRLSIGLMGSRDFLAQNVSANSYGSPALTFSGTTLGGEFDTATLAPTGTPMVRPYAALTASPEQFLRPQSSYQLAVQDALKNIAQFSATEASAAASPDAWIDARMPRLLPVYINSSENEPSPAQIIAKLEHFSFDKVLFITDGKQFGKELQSLDGRLALSLHWQRGDGPAPIVAAVRKLLTAS